MTCGARRARWEPIVRGSNAYCGSSDAEFGLFTIPPREIWDGDDKLRPGILG